MSIIVIGINGQDMPIKRHRGRICKKVMFCLKETHLRINNIGSSEVLKYKGVDCADLNIRTIMSGSVNV